MGLEGWDRTADAFAWTRKLLLEEHDGLTLIKGQPSKPSAARAG